MYTWVDNCQEHHKMVVDQCVKIGIEWEYFYHTMGMKKLYHVLSHDSTRSHFKSSGVNIK